jgi:hypothetical protein
MKAGLMDELAATEGVRMKHRLMARTYRYLPVIALLAVVVEGLGAGVKWD